MDCKMQVSVGQLPPCAPPPPSLPCGAETGVTLGFPKRAEPLLPLLESWSSCFGLSGPYPGQSPYRKQGGPPRLPA